MTIVLILQLAMKLCSENELTEKFSKGKISKWSVTLIFAVELTNFKIQSLQSNLCGK
jgi:hypothetical protein